MRLQKLEARFLRCSPTDAAVSHVVDTLAEANGIFFLCPKCYEAHGGPVGTHGVRVWFKDRGVPDEAVPQPRWMVSGTGMDDLTLTPSVALNGGCGWHGFVTNGGAI